ncbi:MAG: tRNA pseudouridine(13) synthase TruD, partial [Candidatus Acidiferrum sp.]
ALRLALLAPYEHDRAAQKQEKRLLEEHWGDWARCVAVLPRSHARSLADYLRVHPGDFRGAVVRLRPELRGLYLSVYQSHLWNHMLSRWLSEHFPISQLREVRLRLGTAMFHIECQADQLERLTALNLPLPSARLKLEAEHPLASLINGVLAEENLTLPEMRIRGVRDLFFSRGERAAVCLPAELNAEFGRDELHNGRQKLTLEFTLGRGSYATMIVKGIFHHS